MLSFVDSKSSAYIFDQTGSKTYPDENFAREIMQLFTVGIHELNIDGTLQYDSTGMYVRTLERGYLASHSFVAPN